VKNIGTLRQSWEKLFGVVQKWPDKITKLWNNKENLNIQPENVHLVFAAECRCCAFHTPGATSRGAFCLFFSRSTKLKIQKRCAFY